MIFVTFSKSSNPVFVWLVFVLMASVFSSGCSSASMRIWESQYNQKNFFEGKSLSIVLRPKSVTISNPTDVYDDLGEALQSMFIANFSCVN